MEEIPLPATTPQLPEPAPVALTGMGDIVTDVEMLVNICGFLEPKDLGRAACVSHLFGGKINWACGGVVHQANAPRTVVEESARRWVLASLDEACTQITEPESEGDSWLRRMHFCSRAQHTLRSATLAPLRKKPGGVEDWIQCVCLLANQPGLGGELFFSMQGYRPGAGRVAIEREQQALRDSLQSAMQSRDNERRLCAWVVALENQFYQAAVDVAREMGVSLGDLRHALVVNSCLASAAPCRQYTTTD